VAAHDDGFVDRPDDERIAIFIGLRDHLARQLRERPGGDAAGSFIAEGDLVIQRALDAGWHLETLLVDNARTKPLVGIPADAQILRASPEVLRVISGRTKLRDPLACFTRRPLPDTADLLAASRAGAQRVAVLENVTNPNNAGMIMRAAAGLGVDGVLIDPTSCDPLYRRAIRASMGEVFALPHARLDQLPASLDEVHRAGFTSVALTPSLAAAPIEAVAAQHSDTPVALVLGAEGPGLSADTRSSVSVQARIPMSHGVDSLNVGVAAAVAFFAFRRYS